MKKLTAFVLSAMMILSLAACGSKNETPADTSAPAEDTSAPAEETQITYAVEAGSAVMMVRPEPLWGSSSLARSRR